MPAISYSILTQGHDKHRRCYSLSPRMLVENIFKHQEFVKRADICALQQWDLHKNINMLRFSDAMAGCGIIFMWVQQIHELHQTSIPVPFVIHVLYYCLHPPPPFRASFLPIKGGLSHFITFPSQFLPRYQITIKGSQVCRWLKTSRSANGKPESWRNNSVDISSGNLINALFEDIFPKTTVCFISSQDSTWTWYEKFSIFQERTPPPDHSSLWFSVLTWMCFAWALEKLKKSWHGHQLKQNEISRWRLQKTKNTLYIYI